MLTGTGADRDWSDNFDDMNPGDWENRIGGPLPGEAHLLPPGATGAVLRAAAHYRARIGPLPKRIPCY